MTGRFLHPDDPRRHPGPGLMFSQGQLTGTTFAFTPDGQVYASYDPPLPDGVGATVDGQPRWYSSEDVARSEIERHYAVHVLCEVPS